MLITPQARCKFSAASTTTLCVSHTDEFTAHNENTLQTVYLSAIFSGVTNRAEMKCSL